jgi:undecaprenyl-diphosphatase
MTLVLCTGWALKQFRNEIVIRLSPCGNSILSHMARITAPARVLGAIAWLDQAELAACRRFNRAVRTAGLLKVFQIASRLGDGVLWYTLIATLALFYGSEGRQVALQCAVAGVSGLVIYRLLKNVLVRERPYMTHAAIVCAGKPLDRFSFPSGHTLHAVSFTVVVCCSLPVLAVVLVPAAVLIALSRVVLGLHYPSDVVAGGLLGALVGAGATVLVGA